MNDETRDCTCWGCQMADSRVNPEPMDRVLEYGQNERHEEEAYWRRKITDEFRALVEQDLADDPPFSGAAKARVLRLLNLIDVAEGTEQ